MGSLFRSEEMCLCQLFLQPESAYSIAAEFGELGIAQFRDLNPNVNAFQRKYVNEVRRCEEMERKLCYIEVEIKRERIRIPENVEISAAPTQRQLIELEATLDKVENEIRELNTNTVALKKSHNELLELSHILRWTQQFFDKGMAPAEDEVLATAMPTDFDFQHAPVRRGLTHIFEDVSFRSLAGVVAPRYQADGGIVESAKETVRRQSCECSKPGCMGCVPPGTEG